MLKTLLQTAFVFLLAAGVLPAQIAEQKPKRILIETKLGNLVVEPDPQAAPETVKAFGEYIKKKVYKKSSIDQVGDGYIQGGKPGPRAQGYSGNGNFSFQEAPPPEFTLKHVRGAIGLCRTVGDCNPAKNSNSTQFYICLAPIPKDDSEFSIFGHIVEGMEVADKIAEFLRANGGKEGVEIDVKRPSS